MSYTSIAFYKPYDCLSQWTKEVPSHTTIADYISGAPRDVYPVGRLDRDSEGLLLLTNDRRANQALLSPTRHVDKVYWAQVEDVPSQAALDQLRQGVTIRAKGKVHHTMPCQVRLINPPDLPERVPPVRYRRSIPTSWLEITIREGKNRQVRKMGAAVGHPVLRLIRYRMGPHRLGKLQPGQWREIKI